MCSEVSLSIGDGANDIPMLIKANVSVGIGVAANSSDFSVGKFHCLKPLMFLHGREAYRRNADIICWSFYKNMLYVMT